jgi:tRNA 5-methylaminomethyl-2-thiouridine biosynthesis bifunctional protein
MKGVDGIPPWFRPPPPIVAPARALVVGGGIAGASVAAALARRGWSVTVAERRGRVAAEASGNPAGIHMPRLVAGRSPERFFHTQAYLHGLRELARLGPAVDRAACGVLQLAINQRQVESHAAVLRAEVLPTTAMRAVAAEEATVLAGVRTDHPALWFPDAGWIDPASFSRALLAGTAVVHLECQIVDLRRDGAAWHAGCADGRDLEPADVVVLANSLDARAFAQTDWLPLSPRRGQVTRIAASRDREGLRCVISHGGYIIPARDGEYLIGATFDRVEDAVPALVQHPSGADDARNLAEAAALLPDLFAGAAPLGGRASLRAMTTDHLPLVGPVVIHDRFMEDFAGLRQGKLERSFPDAAYHPGLWVLAGLGARGLVTAPFAGELLAALIAGESETPDLAARWEMMAALHPARFLVRDLKQRRA